MKRVEKLTVSFRDRPVGVLALSPDGRLCVFEYDKRWLADGFSISPLELPLKPGLFIAKPSPFRGNFGIFEDSLPDGYGRYLIHKVLQKMNVNDADLSALDRLSLVGDGGIGALTYAPQTVIDNEISSTDFDLLQQKALEVLREQQDTDAGLLLYNSGNSGGARPKAVFSDETGHWLVKFRHIYDPRDIGAQEYKYNDTARACGIDVPDFKLINGRYFASRRFDIDDEGRRLHTATAGALLGISLNQPILDYANLLALTGFITQSEPDVEEMYRRMIFNYLTDNKDDHCKNFSFLVRESPGGGWHWRLAPAYDLTLCTEGYNGEHATSVNGTGHPTLDDFVAVGTKVRLPRSRCLRLISQVRSSLGPLLRYPL